MTNPNPSKTRLVEPEEGEWSHPRPDVRTTRLADYQAAAVWSPYVHTAFFGGVGAGKTRTGADFAIKRMLRNPDQTGLIGANTYDQMSQATIRELFYWLDAAKLEYVIHKRPPAAWGAPRQTFPRYDNILSVKIDVGKVAHAFTRVMSDPDPLRGVEVSWYWLDETRDTPENTHDVVLSRCRETDDIKGIITTTPNGEDWSYQRFFKKGNTGKLYGSIHVPTIKSVKAGFISQAYFDTMLASYSPLMAAQELWAQHVNVKGGLAYHAASEKNRKKTSPWGDRFPSRERPIIVGMDFNFSPAPIVWEVAQFGPAGTKWEKHLHVFREIQRAQTGTRQMARVLGAAFPGFFMKIYGDASGGKGTTSNAGSNDYAQIREELADMQINCAINYDQANPMVKDRVENMNSKLENAAGEVLITYDPDKCPLLDEDFRQVGWKPTGKLDDGGIVTRTHATDGLGYAVWKVMPYGKRGRMVGNVAGQVQDVRESV